MIATVPLKEYIREKGEPTIGQELTYVYWDTGFPIKVGWIKRINEKEIVVQRFDSKINDRMTVEINACKIQILI